MEFEKYLKYIFSAGNLENKLLFKAFA